MNLHIISQSASLKYGHGKEYLENVVNRFVDFNDKFEKIYLHTNKLAENINLNNNIVLVEYDKKILDKSEYLKKYRSFWRVIYGIDRIKRNKEQYDSICKCMTSDDVVYFMEYEYIALLLSKIKEYKNILTLHTMDFSKNSYSIIESVYKKIAYLCNKRTFKSAKRIIVHGEYIKDSFINSYFEYKNKIVVANYGVDIESRPIEKSIAYKYLEESYNVKFPDNKSICLIFGLMRKNKGIDKFVSEFKKIKNDKITLFLVGKNYDINESLLNSELNKNVVWINRYIDEEEIKYFFSISDCLILPYLKNMNSQSGPLKIAMAYNLPVLCSKYGEIGFFTKEYEVGEVFDTETYDDMNDKLVKAMDNSKEFKKSIEKVKKKMSWENMAESIWKSIICEEN